MTNPAANASGTPGAPRPTPKNRLARLRRGLSGTASLSGAASLSSPALRHPALAVFLLGLLGSLCFILPFVMVRGGILYVSNDQITQQMPIYREMVRAIHSGEVLYSFTSDLGGGFVESYAWYNLGSPFFWLMLLFPAAAVPYLLAPMLALKFACGGLLAYVWLRRFTQTDLAAACGGLLYAFSGIAITNMVFPFADVYALFPLLPLGMELALGENRHGAFALAVALNILVNPTLFVGEVVFMAIYFLARLAGGAWRLTLKRFAWLCGQAVCGVLLSCVLLLPYVASLAANPRVGVTLSFGRNWLLYGAGLYFEIARSLVLPPEVMHTNSMMLLHDATSPELYLPLFGMVAVFAFALPQRGGVLTRGGATAHRWLKYLLAACAVFLLVPILNSAFSGFNAVFYARWLYMPALFCALATILTLENATPLKKGFALWAALAVVFCGCMVLWCTYFGYDGFISYTPLFVANLAICAAGLVCTALAPRVWAKAPRLLAPAILVFAVACGGFNLLFNQQAAQNDFGELKEWPGKTWQAAEQAALPDGAYRIAAPGSVSNQYFGHGSPFSFNSTVAPGVFRLQGAFGRTRTSASRIEYDEPGLWALLGVRYILAQPGTAAGDIPLLNLADAGQAGPYALIENTDALPMVLGYENWIAAESTEGLTNTEKSTAMLHGLVLDAATPGSPAGSLAATLTEIPQSQLAGLDYTAGIAARKNTAASSVTLGNGTLAATLHMPGPGAVLFTLPYGAGWRCTINGQPVEPTQAGYGLMAVPCPAGELDIRMEYRPASGTAGLLLSLGGLLWLAGGFLWRRRAKTKASAP